MDSTGNPVKTATKPTHVLSGCPVAARGMPHELQNVQRHALGAHTSTEESTFLKQRSSLVRNFGYLNLYIVSLLLKV